MAKPSVESSPLAVAGGSPIHGVVTAVTDAEFDALRRQTAGPILVDLWAPWCGPCQLLAPILDELASAYAGRLTLLKVSVDENPALAKRFRVKLVPLLVLLSGKRRSQRIGTLSKEGVVAWIEQTLAAWAADGAGHP